jgi:hypothetical protein
MKCKIKPSWIKVELEHTSSKRIAKKIATDHVREHGCGYYPALKKMEARLKK